MDIQDRLFHGDCIQILNTFPDKCVDVIFADPPYYLQLENELYRPNETRVNGVEDAWDKFSSPVEYCTFTMNWLLACRRVLKDTGTIWVIGTYHNIFTVGKVMQELDYWILNDIVWIKSNPMPNFRGVRFTNAHETLIWAKKDKNQKNYTFNYHSMKMLNDGKQMRSDWVIPLCSGSERIKINGEKVHSTQKPEALLRRVILASSKVGDLILDPFFGTGTTGAVAKKLGRHWVGIEKEQAYVNIALERINSIKDVKIEESLYSTPSKREQPKVPFGTLVEQGLISVGDKLFSIDRRHMALVCIDGTLKIEGHRGSIHRIGALVQQRKTCNGWEFWCYERNGKLILIDELRTKYLRDYYGMQVEVVF
ncbi:MAG: site-specific DNA-methyltransferase [Bacillota bacterium]